MSSTWSFKDSPYEVLGVNPGASEREIRRAYREMAMRHHPDKGGDPQRFRQIQEAYRFLSSHAKALREGRRRPESSREAAYQSALDEYHRTMKEMYEATFRHQAAVTKLMEVAQAMSPAFSEAERNLGKRFKLLRKVAKEISKF